MTLEIIRSDFAFLEDWEDRYRYVIELGRGLPPFPEAYRTDRYKVRGCASHGSQPRQSAEPMALPCSVSRATATLISCAA